MPTYNCLRRTVISTTIGVLFYAVATNMPAEVASGVVQNNSAQTSIKSSNWDSPSDHSRTNAPVGKTLRIAWWQVWIFPGVLHWNVELETMQCFSDLLQETFQSSSDSLQETVQCSSDSLQETMPSSSDSLQEKGLTSRKQCNIPATHFMYFDNHSVARSNASRASGTTPLPINGQCHKPGGISTVTSAPERTNKCSDKQPL